MKNKKSKFLLFFLLLLLPSSVFAVPCNNRIDKSLFNNVHFGAVVNDASNTGNLNIVIIGMVIVIIILIGAAIFAKK